MSKETVSPNTEDRVLYRSEVEPQVLRAADVVRILPDVEGVSYVDLHVWASWPPEEGAEYDVSAAAQAPDGVPVEEIMPGTWRSIVEIPGWRSRIGT